MNLELENYLKVFFKTENLINENILIACSGGADSMALLHIIINLQILPKEKIICLHFNHNWSKDSDKAENIVEKFCENNQINFQSEKADQIGQTSEALARSKRYKFFFAAARFNKFSKIFTAHHQDDQVETFFMRLLRGSGGLGIQGINERKYFQELELIRPLLNINKKELIDYCKAHQINYYQDASNLDKKIKRNLIRLELIPLIEKVQPNYKNQISNFVNIMQAQQEFVRDSLHLLITNNTANLQNCNYFNSQSICLQRELLKYLLLNLQIPISFELIEKLRNIINIKSKTKVSLNKIFSFQSDGKGFGFIQAPEIEAENNLELEKIEKTLICKLPTDLEENKIYELENWKIKVKKITKNLDELQNNFDFLNKNEIYVDLSDFENTDLIWRKRLPGDIFRPLNCKYQVKLKKYLIDKKFTNKNTWLLAINETNEILWIPKLEISEKIKVKTSSTHCFQIQDINF